MASSRGGESFWVIVRSSLGPYTARDMGVCSVSRCSKTPEQSRHGHLAIPLASSGGFGGLLANGNPNQRNHTWGNASQNSRATYVACDSVSVTSSLADDIERSVSAKHRSGVQWTSVRGNSKSAMAWKGC